MRTILSVFALTCCVALTGCDNNDEADMALSPGAIAEESCCGSCGSECGDDCTKPCCAAEVSPGAVGESECSEAKTCPASGASYGALSDEKAGCSSSCGSK